MDDKITAKIQRSLSLFPEVRWDRYAGDDNYSIFFGWIDRPDGRSDFMVIDFERGEMESYRTSSAQYSAEFAHRIGFSHADCSRVEDLLPDLKNVIKLKKKT